MTSSEASYGKGGAAAQARIHDLRRRVSKLQQNEIDLLFLEGRSFNAWLDAPVEPALIRCLYDIAKMAPTSMNCCPARYVFICSEEGKEQLKLALAPGNISKVLTAPVVAIIGFDTAFHEKLPILFPHRDVRQLFAGREAFTHETAFRNSTLQGAWLMLAARALGLDCGPMSGFDNARVDELFFPGTAVVSNFLCSLGYGDPSSVYRRLPRLSFDEACKFA